MLYRNYVKRILDIIGSFTLLVLLSPLLLITAIVVAIKLGFPVIYVQKRPGLGEKPFRLYKFRSMKENSNGGKNILSDEERLTPFGKILRATSLDELPELINILKGDMSLVGPRPLLIEYLPLYNERHRRRHEVRPGLTGMAQVMGRNMVSWEDRFDLDVDYVDNLNLLNDLKIVIKTLIVVLRRDGISGNGAVTMTKFSGYHNSNKND